MIKTVRIENTSKWRLCSRTERWLFRSPNPISTVQNENQWVTNLSSKFQVDRPIDKAGSDIWWNLGSEEKTWIFLSNFKNGGSLFLSLFSYLWWLQKIRRRRRRGIIFLALLYKGLRGLKFWALNLGLPHEEKNPTNLPISDYVEGLAILAIEQQTSSFSLGKDFVNISEPLWSVCIFSSSNKLSLRASFIQWYLTSMCFDLAWKVEFLLRWMALWLSQYTT